MDKILLIDTMNAIWRAAFSFSKKDQPHAVCADACSHEQASVHCVCSKEWDLEQDKCSLVVSEDYVIIYNFFRNLCPLIRLFSPEKCFFVLEGRPQFRYDLLSTYKSSRIIKNASPNKQKVLRSADDIINLLQYFPVTICRAANYEADDLVGSLCENMKDEDITIISNDSDFIQLLQRGYKSIRIYNPIKKEMMEAPSYPHIAWKSINGDTSDDIPSLMTPKKAEKIVSDPKLFAKFMSIEENRANFSINRQLIELRSVPDDEIIIQEGIRDFNSLKKEFSKMKFQSIINDKSWKTFCETFDCLIY